MTDSMSSVLKRLAIGLIGQALPEASAFSTTINQAKNGVIAATVAGALIAAFVMLLCFGLYSYLLSTGMGILPALSVTTVIVGLLAAVSLMIARQHFTRVEQSKRKMEFFPEYQDMGSVVEDIVAGFLEGFQQQAVREELAREREAEATAEVEVEVVEVVKFPKKGAKKAQDL